jgi:replicative DNA helicase
MALPCNIDAERFILGSILLDETRYPEVAGIIGADDFSLEKHRRIYRRMADVQLSGESIDRVTVANALMAAGELESVDGLSYLIELDNGLPSVPNVDAYARIVRDKATLRQIIAAGAKLAAQAELESADPVQLLAAANGGLLKLAERGAESSLLKPSEIIEREGGFERFLDRKTRKRGIPWGYPALDKMTGGLERGKMYVLAARPRMGKTALALNIAERVSVDRDEVTAIFSLEMGDVSLLDRLICSRARVNLRKFTGGFLNEDERKRVGRAAGEIAASDRILIDQKAITDITEMHAKVRKAKARGNLGLVIIDYLQLMLSGDDKFRVAEMSRISRNCKVMLKDCAVPGIVLAQLSRKPDERPDHRPVLSDLRESGAIEQDADLVAFIYREDVYRKPDEPKDGTAELIVAKQRDGPEGMIPMVFQGELTRFEQGGAQEQEAA